MIKWKSIRAKNLLFLSPCSKKEITGDFYDFIPLPGGRVGLVIADVADKGMPAALFMVLIRSLMRAAVLEIESPAAALARVNALFYPDAQQGMFITAAYAVIDTATGKMVYANAGHNPPLWVHNGQVERLTRTGMALGVVKTIDMDQHEINLESGDSVLFFTDGITEAFSENDELFGEERLHQVVKSGNQTASAILDGIDKALDAHIGSTPPADDITMVSIKKVG